MTKAEAIAGWVHFLQYPPKAKRSRPHRAAPSFILSFTSPLSPQFQTERKPVSSHLLLPAASCPLYRPSPRCPSHKQYFQIKFYRLLQSKERSAIYLHIPKY